MFSKKLLMNVMMNSFIRSFIHSFQTAVSCDYFQDDKDDKGEFQVCSNEGCKLKNYFYLRGGINQG